MAKVNMKRIFICGLKSQRKDILDTIQMAGTVQVISEESCEGLSTEDAGLPKAEALAKAGHAEQALAVLDEYAPEKTGLLDSLEDAEDMTKASYVEKSKHVDGYMAKAEEILAVYKKINEHKSAIPKCETRLETLSAWLSLDIPLDFTGTEKSRVFIGSVGTEADPTALSTMIAEQAGEETVPDYDLTVFSTAKTMTSFMIVCHVDDAMQMENLLRRINFVKAPMSRLVPSEEAEAVKQEIKDHEAALKQLAEGLSQYTPDRPGLRFASDYYTIRAEKYDVMGRVSQSQSAFFITGYIPEKAAPELEKRLAEYDTVIELSDPAEDEDVPVDLENGFFSDPVVSVVKSYALPSKTEIDPSKIIACFYYVLFGMMLSDAGYGLILVIACGIVLLKVKHMKPSMERMMKLMFFSGISATFWGFMFGSFFGDAIDVIAATFFNRPDIKLQPIWFNPQNEPIRLLTFAFIIGIIHLFTAMIIKFYQLIKAGDVKSAIYDVVFWLMFVGGCIVYLLTLTMITDMLGLSFTLGSGIGNVAAVIAITGCVGVVLTGGRDSKNPVKRLLKGAYSAYGVTSWLSDILSYSRLLALGLATGCIAQVFNKLGTMAGNSLPGIIFFIVVFIFGNLMNLAINVLGAYVHTNRLQFVEFFGKFYDGGGREYEPFTENTKYYSVKEDI